jgi:hypothetical protein
MSSFNFGDDDDINADDFDLLPQQRIVWDDSINTTTYGDDDDLVEIVPPDGDLVDNLLAFNALNLGEGEEGLIIPNSILGEQQDDGYIYAPIRSLEEEAAGITTTTDGEEEAGPSSGASLTNQIAAKSSTVIVDEDDPLSSLEAAIEDDKPKYKTNKDWQAMIASIQAEEDGGIVDTGAVPQVGEQQQQQQQQQEEEEEEGRPPPPPPPPPAAAVASPSGVMRGSTTATTTTSETTVEDQRQQPVATTMPDLRVLPKEEQQEGEGGDSPLGNALLIGGARASFAHNDSEDDDDSGRGHGSKGLRPSISGRNNSNNNNDDFYYKIT